MSSEIEIKTDTRTCRICLEESEIDNLIHPCKCDGHSKYVHPECLKKWRSTSEVHNDKCQICRTEYKKVGKKIKHSILLNKHRQQFSQIVIYAFLIIMLYAAMIYAIDIDKTFAISVGIYEDSFLQQFRIYYILNFAIWMFFLFNSVVYELNQMNRDMFYKYILLPSNKIYLLFYLTIILYYSLGFEYTNFVSDFFSSVIVYQSFIKTHNNKVVVIDDMLDTVIDFDS